MKPRMPLPAKADHLRHAIALVAAFAACAIVFSSIMLENMAAADETTTPPAEPVTSDEALARLEQGNRRCVEGKSLHGRDQDRWRKRFLVKQEPFATVLGCTGSRVPPERLFDQGFGELFVIRLAGNIVDPDVVGSIQYAVEHLDNKSIVVLGHQNCGVVAAESNRGEPPEGKLLDRIRPAIASVDREPGTGTARRGGGRGQCACIDPAAASIAAAIKEKKVQVVGAVYHIDSGKITFRDE